MNNEKLKIGVYLRISNRERALFGYGLDVQKNKIMDCLKLYEVKYSSLKVYTDDGYSARNMDRPQMNMLISDIKANKVDVVYIYKLDRLARNVIDTYKFIDMLIKFDCSLVAVLDRIDIQTANGRLLVGVLAILAQWELETISERTADGIAQMVENGKYPYGRLPYGYRRDKNKNLYIYEPEAKIVRKVFNLACSGLTIKEIELKLLDENIDFTTDQIKHMLTKKLYYGEFEFKGTVYEDFVPSIITKDIYELANKIISKKFKKYGDNVYWFSNKIHCECGEICTRKVTIKHKIEKYYYYYCPKCKKRINQDRIVDQVLNKIEEHRDKIKITEEKKHIIVKTASINKKIEKFHQRYLSDQIDFDMYITALKKFEEEKNKLNAQEKVLKQNIFLKWTCMKDVEKKAYIDTYVKRIVINTNSGIVTKIHYIYEKNKIKKHC